MKTDVAIIGGGAVGLCAALMAARQNLRVIVVEAHEPKAWRRDRPDLRVVALALDNQAMLASYGVWQTLQTMHVRAYSTMQVFDEVEPSPLCFHAADSGRDCLGHILENTALTEALWQAVAAEKNITLYCPDKLESLQNGPDSVQMVLRSGAEIQARLAIGADGAASKVRQLLAMDADVHDYGQKGIVAFVETENFHRNTAWQRFLSTGPLAFLPYSDSACSIVWSLPNEKADALLAQNPQTFCQALDSAFAGTLGKTRLISERAAFPLKRQLARSMRKDRVLLLGDAAHTVHPLAGQGVNLGFRDVGALQSAFEKAQATGSDPINTRQLDGWARQCYSDNAMAALAFENINRIFSNDNMALSLIRGRLLGLTNQLPPLKAQMIRLATGM